MIEPKQLEDLIWQARARVTWGDDPEKISKWLASEGVDPQRIGEILGATMEERDTEVRKLGVREMIIGGAISAVCGTLLLVTLGIGVRSSRGFVIFGAGTAYGVYRLIRGITWLSLGKNVHGSVGDLDQQV